MSRWILAKRTGTGADGEPEYEYFTGEQGARGGPSRSPFRADAFGFHDARSARECADTHGELRDSDEWVVLEVIDGNRMRPWRAAR